MLETKAANLTVKKADSLLPRVQHSKDVMCQIMWCPNWEV